MVSNPPYIADTERDTLQPDVRLHEPESALFAGTDGLDVVRRLAAESPRVLVDGGRLMFEISDEQADVCCELLTTGSYEEVRVFKDLSGLRRVVHGVYRGD